ncbi:MAG: hypothetical protein ACR2J8_03360 [Thermomicrobiales bacterium]
MLKPLLALVLVGGGAWFGYDALRDGALNLPNLNSAPVIQEIQDSADPAAAATEGDAAAADPNADPARQFSRALGSASDQARDLFRLGERKSRNIPDILGEQQKMGDRLAEIDALIASGTLPPELQPAIDAYTQGSSDVREAMGAAKSGFTHLDWDKVRGATEQMGRGFQSLSDAAKLAGN